MLRFQTREERERFEADMLRESLLFGSIYIVTNPADGGPPRVVSQLDYDITFTEKGEYLATARHQAD